ncbi:MAG: hypothetical protein QM599_00075 [Pseudoxanthomonas sp.]
MTTLRQQVHEIADQLPPEATWEDVRQLIDERAEPQKLEALRNAIRQGAASLDAGRSQRFESVQALAEHMRKLAREQIEAAQDR